MKTILIADDQIPDAQYGNEKDVVDHYRRVWNKENNTWDDDIGFAEGYVFMRKLVGKLIDIGYEVIPVSKASDILPAVRKQPFECIILDLGWYNEYELGYREKMALGWKIAKDIRAITPSTPIIMFSNRFPKPVEGPALVETAAKDHLLPVFKEQDDNCIENLKVALTYSIASKNNISDFINERKQYVNFSVYRILCYVLAISVIVTSITILGAFILGLQGKTDIAFITGLISAGSTFLNAIIYNGIRKFRK